MVLLTTCTVLWCSKRTGTLVYMHMLLRLCRLSGYSDTRTKTVITRFHVSVPITGKRLLKVPTEHLSHTNGSLWFVNKMKKTWMKALEATFADSLSQTWWLLFDVSSLFWVDCVMPVSPVSICAYYVCSYWISASVGHMNSFCMCVGEWGCYKSFLI